MEISQEDRLARELTIRYALVLAVIAGLSLGAYLIMKQAISANESSAALINVSGRQRMLSQRITMLAENQAEFNRQSPEYLGTEFGSRDDLHHALLESIELMERSHEDLTKGNPKTNISGIKSEGIRTLYFGPSGFANREVRTFLDHAKAFAATAKTEQLPSNPKLIYLLKAAPSRLLNALDAVVAQHQRESEQRTANLQQMQIVVLIIILIVVVFSAISVFRPMVARVRRDIQERQRAEEASRWAKEEAERSSQAKTDFLANMSHELRTPLNAIIGFSEVLKQETFGPVGGDKTHEYLNDINHSGKHLLEVINDILDISKIEAGEVSFEESEIEAHEVIHSCLRMIKVRAKKKDLALTTDLASHIPTFRADARHINPHFPSDRTI